MADVAAARARIDALTQEDERALLERLIAAGWGPGCWLQGIEDRLLGGSPQDIVDFLDACSNRPPLPREKFEYEDPEPWGFPCTAIDSSDPVFVVVTQRCDIACDLRSEPVVEVARACLVTDKGRIKPLYWRSTRLVPIDPRADSTHCLDLRTRYLLPKVDLDELPAQQALPPDHVTRARFTRKLGRRYSRSAIPDQAVMEIVDPLHALLRERPRANQILVGVFLDPGSANDGRMGLRFVCEDEDNLHEAEDMWDEIAAKLSDKSALLDLDDDDRNGVVPYADFTVPLLERSYMANYDDLSYRTEDGAEPTE
jgi:hypothetical protein